MNLLRPSKLFRLQRGAFFIELIISLPLFLAVIFFFIWLGVTLNARSSLTSAVTNAVRLAATRGDNSLTGFASGAGLIQAVSNYCGGPYEGCTPTGPGGFSNVEQLLTSGELPTGMDPELFYDDLVQDTFSACMGSGSSGPGQGCTLSIMPPEYIYAYVYVVQALKLSIGPTLRTPCDPEDISGADDEKGAGCVQCNFLRPDDLSFDPEDPIPYTQEVPRRRIGLFCRYQPASIFMTPLANMLKLITGNDSYARIIITRKAFMDVPAP